MAGEENFPVVENDQPVGILTRNDLLRAVRLKKFDEPVENFMTERLHYCTPDDNLTDVIQSMEKNELTCVLVMIENNILGLITPDLIWRLVRK